MAQRVICIINNTFVTVLTVFGEGSVVDRVWFLGYTTVL